MNTDMIIAILSMFLFGWSCYRTGVNQGSGYYDEYIDKWYIQLIVRVFCFFIESPLQLIVIVFKKIMIPFLWIWTVFQIKFYFTYYTNKNTWILNKSQLESINRITINVRNTKKLKDRIYRHGTKLINKRNNFNPELIKEEN